MFGTVPNEITFLLLMDSLINKYAKTECPLFVQFILDCSCLPEVVSLCQTQGQYVLNFLFKMTRTYCHSMHRSRLIVQTE